MRQRVQTEALGTDLDLSSFNLSHSSLPSEPPTPPTKSSEALRANLQSVNGQLNALKRQWDGEKHQLLGEKAVLQDATNRLNAQVLNAKDEMKRVVQNERAGEKKRVGVEGVRRLTLLWSESIF